MDSPDPAVEATMAGAQAGDTLLFEDISFSCAPGEWLLLCGPSGAGKTSLLRAVNGLHPLSNGSMRVLGSLLPGRSATESRAVWQRTGTVLEDLGLFESRTALGNVELPLLMTGLRARSRTELARSVIARLALDAVADRFPCELPGGQRQRVALARATVAKPALLILDEPMMTAIGLYPRLPKTVASMGRPTSLGVARFYLISRCTHRAHAAF
jgi:ABC-type methionine transport system ATPase subunit